VSIFIIKPFLLLENPPDMRLDRFKSQSGNGGKEIKMFAPGWK
jgi:hypothetical protein